MRLLKDYPIIPALFFILFAWSILHFLTPYKPALRKTAMDNSPALWQNDDSLSQEWQIRITDKFIHFQESSNSVWQAFTYYTQEAPVLTYVGISTTRKSHIKIFILPEKKGKRCEALILQEDKNYYGLLVASQKNKTK
jgi:hypothetical protein